MKPVPLQPAELLFDSEGGPPVARLYGQAYHPLSGAGAQARHVFLQGNGLPGRWAGRQDFTVLETGFGLGHNFLATWDAWRADPARCARLHVVSVERHPLRPADLARAHAASPWPDLAAQLLRAWPALTPGLHLLDFAAGRVRLLLALGDAAALLPRLRLRADAYYLDGFAPARNPDIWQPAVLQALGRLAAPGATLAAGSAAPGLRAGLLSAGFERHLEPLGQGDPRDITRARFAPRHTPRRLPDAAASGAETGARRAGGTDGGAGAAAVGTVVPGADRASAGAAPAAAPVLRARHAVVVGAGLAGAAVAQALAQLGVGVTVLEHAHAAATQASGNPAGLFHGTVNADDGPYARLFRAAALHAQRSYGPAVSGGAVPGAVGGLLRLGTPGEPQAAMQALLDRLGLPTGYVQALDADAASALAGVPLPGPAWHYPGGGWLHPAAWVQHALATPGVQVRTGQTAASVQRSGDGRWAVCGAQGQVLAEADTVVLAAAEAVIPLLQASTDLHRPPAWPERRSRGQVSHWGWCGEPGGGSGGAPRGTPGSASRSSPGGAPGGLRLPVAGDGYAIPLPGGGLLCGATRQDDDPDPRVRDTDHQLNLQRLQRLTGLRPPADPGAVQGRVGWRLHSADRLPVAGALPLWPLAPAQRADQARLLPRHQGLFVLSALGARGLTLAPLLGRLVAAQATGTPWPLTQDLADAVDPARWLVRAARKAGGATQSAPATAFR